MSDRVCAEDALSPGVTCPPDGPEDCGSGSFCQTASHDRTCRVGGILTLCHTDRDCELVSEWLRDGTCAENGVCELELGDDAPWAP